MLKAMLTFHNQFATSHSFLSPLFQNRRQITQLTRFIKHDDPWIERMLARPKKVTNTRRSWGILPPNLPTPGPQQSTNTTFCRAVEMSQMHTRLIKTRLQRPHNSCHLWTILSAVWEHVDRKRNLISILETKANPESWSGAKSSRVHQLNL